MTPRQLNTLITKRLVEAAVASAEPGYAGWFFDGCLRGAGISPFPPGTAPGPLYRAGIFILDDRAEGMEGPDSFDRAKVDELLLGCSLIALDSAEPGWDIYDYFMDEVASGKLLLIVQTTEVRHQVWRDFLAMHWSGSQIAEVIPVKGDPERQLRAFVTEFNRPKGPIARPCSGTLESRCSASELE
jgi:hypothetical protein